MQANHREEVPSSAQTALPCRTKTGIQPATGGLANDFMGKASEPSLLAALLLFFYCNNVCMYNLANIGFEVLSTFGRM